MQTCDHCPYQEQERARLRQARTLMAEIIPPERWQLIINNLADIATDAESITTRRMAVRELLEFEKLARIVPLNDEPKSQ